jgi:hypothetical protein
LSGTRRVAHALAVALALASATAAAEQSGETPTAPARRDADACAPRQFRWQEDCRPGDARELLIDRLRAIPLVDDNAFWLTLGGEYRFRVESLDEPTFGLRPVDDYTAVDHRWFMHADLRSRAGPRLFLQLSAAAEDGREPRARPFDRSALDLAQAFVDVPLTAGGGALLLRVGRQELDMYGNRLVSTREAANLRRAFDIAFVSFTRGPVSFSAFAGRPVENRAGAFDDRRDHHEQFRGGVLEVTAASSSRSANTALFYFERERARAVYADFVGAERRRTAGIRHTRSSGAYDIALQAAYQLGDAGPKQIRAYGLAGDVGLRQPQWPLQPRFGLSFGVASGDRHADDSRLNTFDVLYPNLGYFTDAPVFYPGNTTDLQPNLTVRLSTATTVQSGCDFIVRNERADALYDPPGIPLARPVQSGADRAATLCYLKAQWRPSPHVEWSTAYVHGAVNAVLQSAGARAADYWLAQIALKL